jgi:hypothetical protein
MYRQTLIRIFSFLFATLVVSSLNLSTIQASNEAETAINREAWKADDYVLAFEENYNFPNRLIVLPITTKGSYSSSLECVRELYYYFATRSGVGDFPFHYIVGWDGKIYSGNKLGNEARIVLSGTEEAIVVAYLADDTTSLTISSISSVKSIILEAMNYFAINPDNVTVKTLNYSLSKKGKLEEVSLTEASTQWQEDISFIKEFLREEYAPQDITFKAELVEITIPEEEQAAGATAEIKIKIKNTGEFNLYSGTTSNIFATRREPFDEQSKFYLADEWASPSRVGILDEGERLKIGEEKECNFNVYVPLYPPEVSEDFILLAPDQDPIEGSEFSIKLKIKKPEQQIIEISETEVGYLNVRSRPGLGDVITKVTPGERFLVLDYQSGYYKISVNGKEGWVVNMYVKVVSS